MARLGDLLQTTPLLHAIKSAVPDCELHLLSDAALHEAVALCGCVDVHHGIATESIRNAAASGDIESLFSCLHEQCSRLRELVFDAVYTLNYGMLGVVLAAVPRARRRYGYVLSDRCREPIPDPWFALLQAVVRHRPLAPFNLSDLFCRIAGVHTVYPTRMRCAVPRTAQERAEDLLSDMPAYRRRIAMHIATRHRKRQWPAASFAAAAERLLDDPETAIVVTGTKADLVEERMFTDRMAAWPAAKRRRLFSLVGATKISELAAILQHCSVLIAGDTGVLHLAAAVGCKTVSLFLGPANFGLTGPYGTGHLVLRPKIPCAPCCEDEDEACGLACMRQITPGHVLHAVRYTIDGIRLPHEFFETVDALASMHDGMGILYAPLEGSGTRTFQDLCYRVMGHTAMGGGAAFVSASGQDACALPETPRSLYGSTLLDQIETLNRTAAAHPYAPILYRLRQDYSFWHPWIDFYHLLLQHSDEHDRAFDPTAGFREGLSAAARILTQYDEPVMTNRRYDN